MSASQVFGLFGAFLTTIGVALTLYGLRQIRDVFRQFTQWVSRQKDPVTIYAEAAIVEMAALARGRGKGRPGPDGWSDERWHDELDKRIDAVENELDTHRHLNFEKSIKALRKEGDRQQKDLDRRIGIFENETKVNERWNVVGLVLVLFGAVAQLVAVAVA